MYRIDGFSLTSISPNKYGKLAFRVVNKQKWINTILIIDGSEFVIENGFKLTMIKKESIYLHFYVSDGENELLLETLNLLHEIRYDNVKVHFDIHRVMRL